jgi:hypothetical protein
MSGSLSAQLSYYPHTTTGRRIATRFIASLYRLIKTVLARHDVVSHRIVVHGSLPC